MNLPRATQVLDRIRQQYVSRYAARPTRELGWPEKLELLRCCFTLGSESENYVRRGEEVLRSLPPELRRLPEAQAFQAAFLALTAKYALWPIDKFSKVNQALQQFDRLERQHPDHLEALFLNLAVSSRLPAVFNRRGKAADLARRVNALLDRQGTQSLDSDWQEYALDFLVRNGLRQAN